MNHPAIRFFMRQLPDRLIIALCTCGPVGRWGKAPGTNGTIVGLLLYTVLFYPAGPIAEVVFSILLIGFALVVCDEGERRLQKRDPGEIILDEIVAVPLCFLGLKGMMAAGNGIWAYMILGFALFRLFDILKPFGIRRLQRYPGGVGVVVDDLAAAVATNITIRLFVLAFAYGGWGNF